MNKLCFLLIASLAVIILVSTAEADLVHAYNFSADAPLADDAGTAELIAEGDVVFSPEGFVTFDGKSGYLLAEDLNPLGQVYTVSFWVRSDDFQPSEEDVGLGILSSTDKNPFAKGNWGVSLNRNIIRFGGKTLEGGGVVQALIEKPEPATWHLITLKFNGEEGGGSWTNDGPYVPFAALRPEEGDPLPSYEEIRKLIIGSDHLGKNGFTGDIANIRISSSVAWDDAKQAAAFLAGPPLGAKAAPAKK